MKVRELIAQLEAMDGERIVILQKDGEGNGYSPLAGVDGTNVAYAAATTWSGECGLEQLTDKARADGYGHADVVDGPPAVCLYPVN